MEKIAQFIDDKYRPRTLIATTGLSSSQLQSYDKIVCKRLSFVGLVLPNDDILLLHTKHLYSVRFKPYNLSNMLSPIEAIKFPEMLDKRLLETYFTENEDNPYGMYNVFNCITQRKTLTELTQFPPLSFPKTATTQEENVQRLYDLALPGDGVFTYDRASGISRLIRKYDWGHWSHCGRVDKNKDIVEATTVGVRKSPFSSLCRAALDVGLYRLKEYDQVNMDEMERFYEIALGNPTKFNWTGMIRAFLRRRYRIPFRFVPTPAELMYMNIHRLVGYA